MPADLLGQFRHGEHSFCLFTSFVSFTENWETAVRFARDAKKGDVEVIFELESDQRPLIRGGSQFSREREVLLHPGSVVQIGKCETRDGFEVIKIRDVRGKRLHGGCC